VGEEETIDGDSSVGVALRSSHLLPEEGYQEALQRRNDTSVKGERIYTFTNKLQAFNNAYLETRENYTCVKKPRSADDLSKMCTYLCDISWIQTTARHYFLIKNGPENFINANIT
jgi:hypothetical protein